MKKSAISLVMLLPLFVIFEKVTMPANIFGEDNNIMKEEEKAQFTQVRAKHILVETEQEAKDLLQKIRKGDLTFEDAAKEHSKCPSGKQGGDLGFFGRGVMVKEFEDAAFKTAKGEISEPVKTQFGWHLIKVEETK